MYSDFILAAQEIIVSLRSILDIIRKDTEIESGNKDNKYNKNKKSNYNKNNHHIVDFYTIINSTRYENMMNFLSHQLDIFITYDQKINDESDQKITHQQIINFANKKFQITMLLAELISIADSIKRYISTKMSITNIIKNNKSDIDSRINLQIYDKKSCNTLQCNLLNKLYGNLDDQSGCTDSTT